MAVGPLINAKIYVAQYDLSGDHNQVNLEIGAVEKVCTVFGDAAERIRGGLGVINLSGQGYLQFANTGINSTLGAQLNVADVLTTVAPTGTDGESAEFFKAMMLNWTRGAPVGEFAAFKMSSKSQGQLAVQGTILGTGSKASSADGTPRQLGAVGATQTLFAGLHVFSVSGTNPTLDVVIASATTEGFAGGTTRLTFAQKTAASSQYASVAGPFTDTWWRAGWTIGGTSSPTFSVVIVAGIANNASA